MNKVLLISVIVGLIAVPVYTSRERSAALGLKKALIYTLLFVIWYALALRYILPRL